MKDRNSYELLIQIFVFNISSNRNLKKIVNFQVIVIENKTVNLKLSVIINNFQ